MPRRKKLKLEDLETLLAQYQSEERMTEFQLHKIQETIKDLEKEVKTAKKEAQTAQPKAKSRRGRPPKAKKTETARAEPAAKPKKRRGRPPKAKKTTETADAAKPKARRGRPPKAKKTETAGAESAAKPKARRGRPPKAKKTKTEAASADIGYRLNDLDELILNSISKKKRVMINAELFDLAKKKFPQDSDTGLRGKLNRSIHKLANKHQRLIKTSYPGKGFAYGLVDWKDESGDIADQYKIEDAG